MTYKVTVSSGNNYSIRLASKPNIKANLSYNIEILPVNLDDLNDVTITGNPDKYVLMYDTFLGKWVNKNPDELLSASVTETTSPGLPQDFENQLDIDLDNKIDLDAGTF